MNKYVKYDILSLIIVILFLIVIFIGGMKLGIKINENNHKCNNTEQAVISTDDSLKHQLSKEEKAMKDKYIVCFKSMMTGFVGKGQPTSLELATAWAVYANKKIRE